jgi:hypothetical protein
MTALRWLLLVVLLMPVMARAEILKSPNFEIDESFVGGGGDVQSSSPNFKSDSAIGVVGIGDSASSGSNSYQTSSGYVTTSDPALTFVVPSANINLGALSTSATATSTSTFKVINYTSYGYIVQLASNPPKTGSHTLTAMPSGLSQTGVEQFGINLVHNTSPISLGTNPVAGTTAASNGVAAAGYNSTNNYKYAFGDTIASAPKSSGETDFTIAYIVNAANTTPGGTYSGTINLVCTGTY